MKPISVWQRVCRKILSEWYQEILKSFVTQREEKKEIRKKVRDSTFTHESVINSSVTFANSTFGILVPILGERPFYSSNDAVAEEVGRKVPWTLNCAALFFFFNVSNGELRRKNTGNLSTRHNLTFLASTISIAEKWNLTIFSIHFYPRRVLSRSRLSHENSAITRNVIEISVPFIFNVPEN